MHGAGGVIGASPKPSLDTFELVCRSVCHDGTKQNYRMIPPPKRGRVHTFSLSSQAQVGKNHDHDRGCRVQGMGAGYGRGVQGVHVKDSQKDQVAN